MILLLLENLKLYKNESFLTRVRFVIIKTTIISTTTHYYNYKVNKYNNIKSKLKTHRFSFFYFI